jgi:HK97 family phage major capsid protein
VIENPLTHGSGLASVAVGDFSKYLVHDAGMRWERSDDRFFDTDQVGFRAAWRVDGRVLDSKAFVKYAATWAPSTPTVTCSSAIGVPT